MTVNTLTLYMPGSSVGIQVVEGSQLHLIYVSLGANSIPSAPGEAVRKDPFPQYVDDNELAAALAGVGGGGGAVASVNGQTGDVVLDFETPAGAQAKADVAMEASEPLTVNGKRAVRKDELVLNVKDYGAKGDGTTNDYTAIAAAVSAVATRGGGVVYFPAGTYAIGQKLSVPAHIYLVAEHVNAVTLKLTAGTTIPTFIEMGVAGSISTFTGLRDIAIDANSKANVGVQLWGPQEGSGLHRTFVGGALITGVQAQGGGATGATNMFVIDHCWIWTTGNAGMYGLSADGGIIHVRNTTFVGTNRTAAIPTGSAGIAVWDGNLYATGNNCENWESGYLNTRSQMVIHSPQVYFGSYGVTTSSDSTAWPTVVTNASFSNSVADINDVGMGVTGIYANQYDSGGNQAYARFHRWWNAWRRLGVYKNASEVTVSGYDSPANSEVVNYKQTILTPSGWVVGSMIDGVDGTNGANSSAWNGAHHRQGNYHFWVDAAGKYRMKNGAPTSDTDGTVVGTQT